MSVGKAPAVETKRRGRGPGKKKKPQREYCKGRWTCQEKLLFLVGLRKYGKGKWKEIAKILTTRSPVQIKSHGQKLYSKLKPGQDLFRDLKEYERSTGTHLDPGDKATAPYVSVHDFTLAQRQQQTNTPLVQAPEESLDQDPPMDYESDGDGDYPSMVDEEEEEEGDEENLPPTVAALKTDRLASSSKPLAMSIQSFLSQSDPNSHGLGQQPLWQSHFGSPKGISFLNDSPAQPGSTTRNNNNKLATSLLSTGKRPAQNQQDVHAAMVLCQMDSISKSVLPPSAPLVPTATRPTLFAPKSTTSLQSFSSLAAASAFEPISLKSMDKQRFDTSLLAACFPEILQDESDGDDDDGSQFAIGPSGICEV